MIVSLEGWLTDLKMIQNYLKFHSRYGITGLKNPHMWIEKRKIMKLKEILQLKEREFKASFFSPEKIERSSEIPKYVQAIIVLIEIVCHKDNFAEIKFDLQ